MAEAIAEPPSSRYRLQAATAPFRQAGGDLGGAAFWPGKVDPEQEILVGGLQEGTAHLPLAVLNPGDPALVLDPSYPSHAGGVALPLVSWCVCRCYGPGLAPGEQLSDEQQRQLRLLVLGYPHNPTATTGSQQWLEQAMAIAKRSDAVLGHDNFYVDLALEGHGPTLLHCEGWRERGIDFLFSKGWCLAGFRLAFAVGAPALIEALARVKGVVDFNQSLALQAGAIAALQEFPDWRGSCATATASAAISWPNGSQPRVGRFPQRDGSLPVAAHPRPLRDLGSEAAAQWLLRNRAWPTPGVGLVPVEKAGCGWRW